MDNELDLFDFLKHILDCTYISDLKYSHYNDKAKMLLKQLNLKNYSLNQIDDALEYIYNKK